MFTKFKVYLCMILCMISLVSVGFSSWTIYGLDEEEIELSINSDNVINSKDYVYLDTTKGENNSGIDCFKYYEYGYLDKDGYLSNYGYITTFYKLDLKKCKELFGSDNDSIEINLKLHYADDVVVGTDGINLFENSTSVAGSRSINAMCEYTENYVGLPTITMKNTSEKANICYSTVLVFEDILKNYNTTSSPEFVCFKVEYELFSNTGAYFTDSIYKFLYSRAIGTDKYTGFKVDVFVSGI